MLHIEKMDIIIPQRGRTDLTLNLLSGLVRNAISPAQIYIVDNGTPSAELNQMKNVLGSDFNLLISDKQGITHAWNLGWQESKAPVCLFLNNDVIIQQPFQKLFLDEFDKADTQIVGLPRHKDYILDELVIAHPSHFQNYPQLVQGWCFAVRRTTLETLKCFDEELQMYFSDTDFLLRTQQTATNAIQYFRNIPLIHMEHQTLLQCNEKKLWWKQDKNKFLDKWNRLLKHASTSDL